MNRALALTATILSILACGGGGNALEGTWWCNEDRVNPECWYFEGGVVKNTLKGGDDHEGSYDLENNTLMVDWGKKRDVFRITNQTATVMEWRNEKSGRRTLHVAKDEPIR